MAQAGESSDAPGDLESQVKAIESLLIEKGLLDPRTADAIIDAYEHQIGPHIGARVVARAWLDPGFKARLLANGSDAAREMDISGLQGEHLVVVENTDAVHNLVVCTLCSCYPWAFLGLPPTWYKSHAYRARAVIEPRAVLAEFGLAVPLEKEVRVWDSTAELRYLVLPQRPCGTDGW
ncbi:MAG: nitrile hydratase subunit alpha, partial [Parvibaculaceae bacterium]